LAVQDRNTPKVFAPQGQTTLCAPHVRLLGDVAVVTYVRLTQGINPEGLPHTTAHDETRVWHRRDSRWRHVHFHRSPVRGS